MIEQFNVGPYQVKIEQDDLGMNPRDEECNLGIMICKHRRHILGDEAASENFNTEDFSSWADLRKHLVKEEKAEIILPLYLMDHSGLSMSTSPFGCQWDSGLVGLIYTTKERIQKFLKKKRLTKKVREEVTEYLKGEVKTYDQYLRGEVYMFLVEHNGEHIDSCSGFYDIEECKKQAQSIAEYNLSNPANSILNLSEHAE